MREKKILEHIDELDSSKSEGEERYIKIDGKRIRKKALFALVFAFYTCSQWSVAGENTYTEINIVIS